MTIPVAGEQLRRLRFFADSVATYYRFGGANEAAYGALRMLLFRASNTWRGRRWQRYLAAHPGVPEVSVNGCDFSLDRSDIGISAELAIDGVHEPHATALLLKQLAPGMTVVDAGSNLGYYAIQESKAVGDAGRVIAIEPNPACFDLLAQNIERNGCRNVEAICAAISDEEGVSDLYVTAASNIASLRARESFVEKVQVPTHALDDLVAGEERIDLVRMDIEGLETRALPGMRETLRTRRPLVSMELHLPMLSEPEIAAVFELFRGVDYELACFVFRMADSLILGRPWPGRTVYKRVPAPMLEHGVRTQTVVTFFVHEDKPLDFS